MPDFPISDTHVHLWDPNRFSYPWLSGHPKLNRPFLPEDYRGAIGPLQVENIVFVECGMASGQSMEEPVWVNDLAKKDPRIRAIIPSAPLEKGAGSRAVLVAYKKYSLIKGVRRLIQTEADPAFPIQPDFLRGVQMLAEYDFSFDICISDDQLKNTLKLVGQCPEISFVLDHAGKPEIKKRVFEPWKSELKALSEFPNVTCKISGMITEADHENWTAEGLKPYIAHVIECFGFDRVLYAGDWPVVTLAGEYQEWVAALDWALSGCRTEDLKKLFYSNAISVYRMSR
ncbi:MAG: amidohydrolase family protein [Candidatus Latescibacterota bacterium]